MTIFEDAFCVGEIVESPTKYDITVRGTIKEATDDGILYYVAAAPPDYRASYSGSALPFNSMEQAFDNTPNKGSLRLDGSGFVIPLVFPNSYYIGLGTTFVPPTLYLRYMTSGQPKELTIKLSEGIPYRSLTYDELHKGGVSFYDDAKLKLPVRTQEQIARDSDYPAMNKKQNMFWGLKPAR